jgi:hypothetical protein
VLFVLIFMCRSHGRQLLFVSWFSSEMVLGSGLDWIGLDLMMGRGYDALDGVFAAF